jgi:hypothetical protein
MPPTDSTWAYNIADFQLDPVAERFFSQAPHEHDDKPARLPRVQQHAMRATFAMLGVFVVALAGFLIYSRVIMPRPAQLQVEATAPQ